MGNIINIPDITPESLVLDETGKTKKTSTFDAKNYLNVRLEEGQTTKTITIRLLPMNLETGSPFIKIHTHSVKVPKEISESGYKSYVCLSKTDIDHEIYGSDCPFCQINKLAYADALKAKENGDSLEEKRCKDVSVANMSRETVVVRCIERGKENEGVKFWKFNLRGDKTDPYHQIMNLYNLRKKEGEQAGINLNILSIYDGRDLNITINEGNAAPVITDASLSMPLSRDENQVKEWITDSKKWQDVFPIKPYEYLHLVSQNLIPWFDRANGKWVDKAEFDSKNNREKEETNSKIVEAENKLKSASPVTTSFADTLTISESSLPSTPDDDLPF